MNIVSLDQIRFEAFAAAVKNPFQVQVAENETIPLELSAATTPRFSPAGGTNAAQYESFVLTFVGPADRVLPQQQYWIESATIGRFELFITPVSRDASGTRYEAVFNRLVK